MESALNCWFILHFSNLRCLQRASRMNSTFNPAVSVKCEPTAEEPTDDSNFLLNFTQVPVDPSPPDLRFPPLLQLPPPALVGHSNNRKRSLLEERGGLSEKRARFPVETDESTIKLEAATSLMGLQSNELLSRCQAFSSKTHIQITDLPSFHQPFAAEPDVAAANGEVRHKQTAAERRKNAVWRRRFAAKESKRLVKKLIDLEAAVTQRTMGLIPTSPAHQEPLISLLQLIQHAKKGMVDIKKQSFDSDDETATSWMDDGARSEWQGDVSDVFRSNQTSYFRKRHQDRPTKLPQRVLAQGRRSYRRREALYKLHQEILHLLKGFEMDLRRKQTVSTSQTPTENDDELLTSLLQLIEEVHKQQQAQEQLCLEVHSSRDRPVVTTQSEDNGDATTESDDDDLFLLRATLSASKKSIKEPKKTQTSERRLQQYRKYAEKKRAKSRRDSLIVQKLIELHPAVNACLASSTSPEVQQLATGLMSLIELARRAPNNSAVL